MTKLLNLPQKYTVFPLKDLSLSNNTRNSNNACNSNNFMQQLFSVTFESKAMKRNNNCRSFFEEIGIYVKCQVETCLDQIKKKTKNNGAVIFEVIEVARRRSMCQNLGIWVYF